LLHFPPDMNNTLIVV